MIDAHIVQHGLFVGERVIFRDPGRIWMVSLPDLAEVWVTKTTPGSARPRPIRIRP